MSLLLVQTQANKTAFDLQELFMFGQDVHIIQSRYSITTFVCFTFREHHKTIWNHVYSSLIKQEYISYVFVPLNFI